MGLQSRLSRLESRARHWRGNLSPEVVDALRHRARHAESDTKRELAALILNANGIDA